MRFSALISLVRMHIRLKIATYVQIVAEETYAVRAVSIGLGGVEFEHLMNGSECFLLELNVHIVGAARHVIAK